MEDVDDFVCRRVRRAFLVAVVEAVELRRDDPRREPRDEDRRFGADPDTADQVVADEEKLRREERSEEAEDVRGQQRSPDEPAPANPPRDGLPRGGESVTARIVQPLV